MKNKFRPFILGFYGESKIGKTILIERLVDDLSAQGYSIAAIKKTDKCISMDTPGKDTARYSQAGARMVVLSTFSETAYVLKAHSEENAILDQLKQMDEFDYIFVEGAFEEYIPKIRLGRITERLNTVFTYKGDYTALLEKIRNQSL